MRTRHSYLVSAALHAGLYFALAVASERVTRPEFGVRTGEAAALYSQASHARTVVEVLDSRLEEHPLALVEITAPADTPPPLPSEPPPMPATSAELDHVVVVRPPVEELLRRRTERSQDATRLADAEPLPIRRAETTPEMDGRVSPPLLLPVPDQLAPTPDQLSTDRPPLAVRPVQGPEVVESGDAKVNSINVQVTQGARVDRLPANLPANPEPPYPEDLRRQRIGGQVILWLAIAADGSVAEVRVDKSSGHAALDDSALTTVRKWRFDPARRSGVPVRYEVRLPITFSVRPG